MKVKLHKEEESRAGKIFLVLNYMSGDADGDFPEEEEIDGTFSNPLEITKDAEDVINKYKLVANITNINHESYLEDYDEIKEEHGEEIADLWQNGKTDPQSDYSTMCHLNEIMIRAYDNEGNMYESYNLI